MPVDVRVSPFDLRLMHSCAPTIRSSSAMDMEMADGAMCSRRAASLMVPVSAATTKCRTWRRVIEGFKLMFILSILLITMNGKMSFT